MNMFNIASSLDDSKTLPPAQTDVETDYVTYKGQINNTNRPDTPSQPYPSTWIVIRPGERLRRKDQTAIEWLLQDNDVLDWWRNASDWEDDDSSRSDYPEYTRDDLHSGNGRHSDYEWDSHIRGNENPTR